MSPTGSASTPPRCAGSCRSAASSASGAATPASSSSPRPSSCRGTSPTRRSPRRRDADQPWTVLASLQGTLTVLSDAGFTDEAAIEWLFTPDDSLPGTPIEALRAGRKTEIRRRAAAEL